MVVVEYLLALLELVERRLSSGQKAGIYCKRLSVFSPVNRSNETAI
jgi:hypothetical protein